MFLEYYHAYSGHLEEADSFLNSIRLQKHLYRKAFSSKGEKTCIVNFGCVVFFFSLITCYGLSFSDGGDTLILVSQIEVDEC